MNRIATTLSIAAAFAAGCVATHLLPEASMLTEASAATEAINAQVIHVPELTGDALGPASPTNFRSKTFVIADGATVSVQDGNVPKHMHPNTNEIQYILEGTGTIWLGDKEVSVKPGDLVIIPKGTAHAGTKPDGRPFKSIAIKTPQQAPDDTKMLD
jgi:mannose-6-phosphate isomerase-like protein (cupin superfamily)